MKKIVCRKGMKIFRLRIRNSYRYAMLNKYRYLGYTAIIAVQSAIRAIFFLKHQEAAEVP
jgi:hypothetical protein